ncbi:uncharacterized protein I303_100659 [Kwoniella dejecticola CBS 10117]|uniref:Uncharacterized protein n=1 Tax=Kwoniella dejecticola CBS 10117 TaxID=1296121 RepID=A0A1A6AFL1_9TREE|nr:uncharacterized protein I303_00663 [Kwoniella dejecticola CBS 10117]OBR88846.1 hypothetical protein I303_00663 [Kwoniella dejecticola CBS 10117]
MLSSGNVCLFSILALSATLATSAYPANTIARRGDDTSSATTAPESTTSQSDSSAAPTSSGTATTSKAPEKSSVTSASGTDGEQPTSSVNSAWAGVVASLAGQAASSASSASASASASAASASASQNATTDNNDSEVPKDEDVRSGFFIKMDAYTCADNGKNTYCNEYANEEVASMYIQTAHPEGSKANATWTFTAYDHEENDKDHKWEESAPIKTYTCDIVIAPGERLENSTIEIHTESPFVKEIDDKELLELSCEGKA